MIRRSRRLVDVLPASIRKFELIGDILPEGGQLLLVGLLEFEIEWVPRLDSIFIEAAEPFDEETKRTRSEKGVELISATFKPRL